MVANNVFAHVPDTNDFAAGLARVLAPEGVLSIEFPELTTMLLGAQLDQIYHEHVFYFSLLSWESFLLRNGLRVIDVERLPTHGGSLRVTACHGSAAHKEETSVSLKREEELQLGLAGADVYDTFHVRSQSTCRLCALLLGSCHGERKDSRGLRCCSKGNTLLNHCGVSTREIAYVVDRSPHKQGHFLPGSHLPVLAPQNLLADRPDYVIVLAWNLLDEVQFAPQGAANGEDPSSRRCRA